MREIFSVDEYESKGIVCREDEGGFNLGIGMVFCRRAGDLSLEDEAEALFVTVGEVSLVGSMVKDSEAGATATVLSDLEIRATVPDLVSGSAEVAAATPVVEGVSTLEVVGGGVP